jgi:GTPase Era involved in 16S rRNA processing
MNLNKLLTQHEQLLRSFAYKPNQVNMERTETDKTSVMNAIKPLIKQKQLRNTLRYKPCAIIMGRTGAGKTTLVNTLCGKEHECGAGSGSITKHLYINDIKFGDHSFSLMDTPGTNSTTETYKHAYLLKEGLTSIPINTIFIVTKYECRFDTMLENYYEAEQPVYNYNAKVVAMISHWDHSKEPEKEFPQICKLFEGYCSNIICYSDKSSETTVANLMYSCISNMEREELRINDKDFFFKFNIAEIKLQTKRSLDQFQKKASEIFQDYSEAVIFGDSASAEEKDEVLHMLIVEFKNAMGILLQEFRQKHGAEMDELDHYVFYIKMEKENVKLCDSFVAKAVPLMSYNLFDNGDPRNLIKRCPSCGLIWFKTEGCDGQTHCGNNQFTNYFDQSSKPFWKYILQRINGKLRWQKNEMEKKEPEKLTKRVANSESVGCGEGFIWSELPKIEDDLILELFKVKTMDEAKLLIQSGNFKEVRQNYERNIDSNFYS